MRPHGLNFEQHEVGAAPANRPRVTLYREVGGR